VHTASQPAVRLPAVKVTLPAAMDYTDKQSQAEYDTALEGRSVAKADREKPSGTSGHTRPRKCVNVDTCSVVR